MTATLYRVQTRTDAIEGYDDVLITWAAAGRTAPVAPYADVIEGLGPGDEADLFRRNAVDELFTFEEAQAWGAYLQRHYSSESSEVVEQPLPLPGNAVALSDMPVGSGVDQIMPVREEDYPFSFQVYGCYDLREHLAETGNPYRFGAEPYPGEIEDLTSILDNRREQVAEDLGTEHPLFRLLDASLRAGDVEELRVARAASESFHINEYPDLEDEDVEDRNIRHFLWYGGFAGEGLRSVGAASPSKSVCSILPLARHLRAGEGSSMLTPARRFAPSRCPKPSLTLTPAGLALWGWQTPYRGSTKLRLIR